jgi:hypothetical protein
VRKSIQKVPVDVLEKLYYIFDDLACTVEYSRDNGELIVGVGEDFYLEFEADRAELIRLAEDKYWNDDAMNVAEGYWRQ